VLLNAACNKTTGIKHTLCVDLLKPLVDEILKLIESGLSNDEICEEIKLCSSVQVVVKEKPVQVKKNGIFFF
jgi:DNA-binding NarL/FixJ family response regulator